MAAFDPINVDQHTGVVTRHNDATRTVDTLDPDDHSVVTETRPYTAEENAQADERAATAEQADEHAATQNRVRAIINDLQAEKARMDAVINTANATINASPAGFVKDTARSAKRIADAAIDLAKYVDGR